MGRKRKTATKSRAKHPHSRAKARRHQRRKGIRRGKWQVMNAIREMRGDD